MLTGEGGEWAGHSGVQRVRQKVSAHSKVRVVSGQASLALCCSRFKNLQKHKSHFVRTAEDERKAALWEATVARLTNI